MRLAVRWLGITIGLGLLVLAVSTFDVRGVLARPGRFGAALAASVAVSALWHAVRTWMWARCFAQSPPFARLVRVRLAGESLSYLTITGVAGDPLKWALLRNTHTSSDVVASIARERIAYLVGTAAVLALACASATALGVVEPRWVWTMRVVAMAAASFAVVALAAIVATRSLPQHATHLAAASVVAFALMIAEAWCILRIFGMPITLTQAIAIESISRAGTLAAVLVPANLGVLEISTVSAALAIGVPLAAAPLALARRARGLIWAAAGLWIYWRLRRESDASTAPTDGHRGRPQILLYLADAGATALRPTQRIAGLPLAERVLRAAHRAQYDVVLVYATAGADVYAAIRHHPWAMVATSAHSWLEALRQHPRHAEVTVVGEGVVPSPGLLLDAALIPVADGVVDVAAGPKWPVTGVVRTRVESAVDIDALSGLMARHTPAMREVPPAADVVAGTARSVVCVQTGDDLQAGERLLKASVFKPTDAKVARFNRRLSLPISLALLRTPITANQLSVLLMGLGFVSAWLFSRGDYASVLAGAVLSLAASILDGCDGEIARLKYEESPLGCWIETVGDYSYYLAILIGMTIGSVQATGWTWLYACAAGALAGTALSFILLIYLRTHITNGEPDRLHAIAKERFTARSSAWSRLIWRLSFVATRAAMPYGIAVLALINAIPLVIVLWAIGGNVYWLSLALKMRELRGGARDVHRGAERVPADAASGSRRGQPA